VDGSSSSLHGIFLFVGVVIFQEGYGRIQDGMSGRGNDG
jgi:hypothetical protein